MRQVSTIFSLVPSAPMDGERHVHAGLQAAVDAVDVETLCAGQVQRLARHAVLELQRQHAHADQVGAVDALEGLAHHGLDAEQVGALGRPVARASRCRIPCRRR